ncbi:hypothetical protein BGZ61DRAFT_439693 [Ilyonectria robusta]|uniref:uncharacterized protein n=1 Tax=Ilyonectria robusta TaxID=1079257 RepID=UPI001E8DF3A4|nr:uncharacterized protein BGZ61DRAFT_439693 [Ilyonectria robusta]KAH8738164.1 hypothetical protein BGZ61DRAFT_439693 [Ilyonectria robusta]
MVIDKLPVKPLSESQLSAPYQSSVTPATALIIVLTLALAQSRSPNSGPAKLLLPTLFADATSRCSAFPRPPPAPRSPRIPYDDMTQPSTTKSQASQAQPVISPLPQTLLTPCTLHLSPAPAVLALGQWKEGPSGAAPQPRALRPVSRIWRTLGPRAPSTPSGRPSAGGNSHRQVAILRFPAAKSKDGSNVV